MNQRGWNTGDQEKKSTVSQNAFRKRIQALNKLLKKKSMALAIVVLFLTNTAASAHNPEIATYFIRNYDAVWMFEASFAQSGLQTALQKYYGEIDFSTLSETVYKKMVVEYVKSQIEVSATQSGALTLNEGAIRLGSHQTDVRFVLEDLPKEPENLIVSIRCLSNNKNQQNILKLPGLKPGEHFVLSAKNDFKTTVNLKVPIGIATELPSVPTSYLVFALLAILAFAATMVYRFRAMKKFNRA